MYKTPIPQAAKSCLSKLNKLSLNQPLLGWFALGLASLATDRQGLFVFPTKERRQVSKLSPGDEMRRDEMFRQGMLWCSGCKQFEPVKNFRKYRQTAKPQTNYGYRYYCNRCTKLQQGAQKDRASKRMGQRNAALKVKFVALAGGACQKCGYSGYLSAFDFHHVYPSEKKFTPTYVIYCGNFEKTWKELDKCCLLCANCHNGYEARLWQAEFIKRDGLGWTVGGELPLDDSRYETEKPPKYQQASMPIFNYEQKASQLTLFESRPAYNVGVTL
jgi:hypothetical protein